MRLKSCRPMRRALDDRIGLGLPSVLIAWGITEVIRYSFYALKELSGAAPHAVLWLRYTTFIVLYPLGVASELALVWLALPELRTTRRLCLEMPNLVNLQFDYPVFIYFVAAMYAPGMMYGSRDHRARSVASPLTSLAAARMFSRCVRC
jgi:Protein tyrosine phosphatase-like protein, PTPLA